MREQRIVLEDCIQLTFVGGKVGDVSAFEDDAAFVRRLESCENPERSGFSAAGGAEQCDELVFVNDEIKIVENDLVAEGLGNVVKMDQLVIQLINPPDLYSGCAGVEWIRDRSPKSIHYIILPGE